MDLTDIITISGKPGLYTVVGKSKNNVIVESLAEGKRFPTFNSNKISALAIGFSSHCTPMHKKKR